MFSDTLTDMQKLSALTEDRLQELLLYRAFVQKKGLQEEFEQLLTAALSIKAIAKGGQWVK